MAEELDAGDGWPAVLKGPAVDPVAAVARVFGFKVWEGAQQPKLRTKTTKKAWLCFGGPMHGAKLWNRYVTPESDPEIAVGDWLGFYRWVPERNRYEWVGEEMQPPIVGPLAG